MTAVFQIGHHFVLNVENVDSINNNSQTRYEKKETP